MPPKKAAANKAAGGRGAKAYQMAVELPPGELINDMAKGQYKLEKAFAKGGFGRIYTAKKVHFLMFFGYRFLSIFISFHFKVGESGKTYVIKMEPSDNGPIFQEMHMYQRIAKVEMLNEWKQRKGKKYQRRAPALPSPLFAISFAQIKVQYINGEHPRSPLPSFLPPSSISIFFKFSFQV